MVKLANDYADELIIDIKMMNPENTKNLLGGNINQFLSNLSLTDLRKVTFRIHVTKCSLANSQKICELIKSNQ